MTEYLLKLCAHRALDGSTCKAPAMRQSEYCRHHRRFHQAPVIFPAYVFEVTGPRSFVDAFRRTLQDMSDGKITSIYASQIMHELNRRRPPLPPTTSAPPSPPPLPANPRHAYR